MNKYFAGVTDIETLRKRYRELLKKFHPDNDGGSVEITQEINAEYDRLFAILSKESKPDGGSATEEETAANEAFKAVLDRIIHINADIEIVGEWIWIEKGSYENRELLKSVGFRFASRKKAWYWHYSEWHRRSKREITLDEIRLKYGSEKVSRQSKQYAVNG